ncbi:MAG: SMP-30/gluconolactonase/LRE family protein, partial [Chloroflexi bacterium]|nr:SMP-30/gluconolactonase/LRE family protein [Chloroflexota bacterium]
MADAGERGSAGLLVRDAAPAAPQAAGGSGGTPGSPAAAALSSGVFPLDVFAQVVPAGRQSANSLQQSASSLQQSANSLQQAVPPPSPSPTLAAASPTASPPATPAPSPSPSPTPAPSISPTPAATASLAPSPSPSLSPSPASTPTPAASPTPTATPIAAPAAGASPAATAVAIETVTAIVTTDKESVLTSRDGKISLRLPAGTFNEEARVEMRLLPPPASNGMRTVKLLDINAYAVKRDGARLSSLLKNAAITIVNTRPELRGLDYDSIRLFYLDNGRWQPVASQFDSSTLTLNAATDHFSEYGELANPVISGPPMIMGFEANLHSGTVKTSYPIELPPGPGGFKPRLALTYDSGRADGMKNKRSVGGWVGIGWSLSPGFISYDETADEYYLELGGAGYELIRSSANSYYTKPDLFYKIVRDEANQQWDMWDRGGVHYVFGGHIYARQFYQNGADPPVTVYYRWDLTLIQDTHGNQAAITWSHDVFGSSVRSAYPTRIDYGAANAVIFNFDPGTEVGSNGRVRYDNPILHHEGGLPVPKVMENGQLNSVEVKVSNALVRKYSFVYGGTGRVENTQEYGGVYYSGKHILTSVTQYGADGTSALPALTFGYTEQTNYLNDPDGNPYTGNPGNPASLSWPRLTSVTNGYGAVASFGYAQKPASPKPSLWTRQAVVSRSINPGIGPAMTWSYEYDGDPEYLGFGPDARFRGFRKVKETDATGNYTWRYFYTTGYDTVTSKDGERLTGREYRAEQYAAGGGTALQTTVNDWNWQASDFWSSINSPNSSTINLPYAFLNKWDGDDRSSAYFNQPWGIAADGSGNVFVVDAGNAWVQKFNSSGGLVGRWSGGNGGIAAAGDGKIYVADDSWPSGRVTRFENNGTLPSQFATVRASGVAVSPYLDYFYVTDPYNNTVTKYTISGTYVLAWNGSGSGTQFSSPYGVATDIAGDVYVADSGNSRIVKFDSSGNYVSQFNGGAAGYAFLWPYGVAVDNGYIYVADTNNDRVTKWDGSYGFVREWKPTGDGAFYRPKAVAVRDGYLYVNDAGNHRVQKFQAGSPYGFVTKWGEYSSTYGRFANPMDVAQHGGTWAYTVDYDTLNQAHEVKKFDASGRVQWKKGSYGTGDGQFSSPKGLGVSPDGGTIYVADSGNNRIQKFSSDGVFQTKWGSAGGASSMNAPYDVAAASDGNSVYIADSGNHRIVQHSSGNGTFIREWGTYGTGTTQFKNPKGVAVDGSGNVLVADTDNHRVMKFDGSGNPIWQKGKAGQQSGSGDGEFNTPTRVAVDSAGNVYLADTGNHRVQKLDGSGNFLRAVNGQFSSPQGIDVSPSGDSILVADTGNDRVQRFTPPYEVRLDGTTVTRGGKTAGTRYSHDGRGNVAAIFRDGDAAIGTDDSTVWRSFTVNTSSPNWMLDRPYRERVYEGYRSSDNETGLKLETRYFYDLHSTNNYPPAKGDLTQIEKYGPAGGSSPNTITFKKLYDSYGNVTTETDANSRNTTYVYDTTHHAFPTSKTLPAVGGAPAMSESYAWNYTGGRMTSETDVNGRTTTYEYDTFWRPIKLIRPGDSSASPTLQHQYQNWGVASSQNIYTIQKVDASTANDLWVKKYFDGVGRVVQTQAR